MMHLRFLGSGDAFGSGGRLQTCLYLSGGPSGVLLDCGASSLVPMKRDGVEPNDIEVVVVTHLHGDHFAGVPFLVLDGQFRRRERDLLVCGPPGLEERVVQAMEVLFPGSSSARRRFTIRFLEIPAREPVDLGPATVTAFEVDHASGAPSYALRVEYADRLVAYSGDTAWTPVLVEVADAADVFVCEAYVFDKQVPHHLDFAAIAEHRVELRCKRLVLTHMSEDMLTHIPELDVEAASDGLTVTL